MHKILKRLENENANLKQQMLSNWLYQIYIILIQNDWLKEII